MLFETLRVPVKNIQIYLLAHRRFSVGFLVLVWGLVQLWLGEWLYTIFLFAIFLMLFILPRRFSLLIIAGAALVLAFTRTPIRKGLPGLLQTDIQVVQNLQGSLSDIFEANSGQKLVLPLVVQEMRLMLEKHPLERFSLEGEKFQDDLIHQRIVESVWPIKVDPASRDIFVLPDAISRMSNCKIVDKWKEVTLVHCP